MIVVMRDRNMVEVHEKQGIVTMQVPVTITSSEVRGMTTGAVVVVELEMDDVCAAAARVLDESMIFSAVHAKVSLLGE